MISTQCLRLHRRGRTCAFKDFCSVVLTCLNKGSLHTYTHISMNACSFLWGSFHQLCSPNFRHDGLSLSSAGGSKVCTKFARTEVKDCPCKSEHGCHKPGIQRQPKPFWKWWPLGRWSHVQTAMNLSTVGQEFQPPEGIVTKGVCQWPALLLTRGKSA